MTCALGRPSAWRPPPAGCADGNRPASRWRHPYRPGHVPDRRTGQRDGRISSAARNVIGVVPFDEHNGSGCPSSATWRDHARPPAAVVDIDTPVQQLATELLSFNGYSAKSWSYWHAARSMNIDRSTTSPMMCRWCDGSCRLSIWTTHQHRRLGEPVHGQHPESSPLEADVNVRE